MADPADNDESPLGADFPLEVYNDLQCPICLEFFKHPIILPCSHVLCRSPCAENLFDFNFIRCPVCRENCYVSGGIGSLPRVIALESIIEKYWTERRKAIQNARKGQKGHRTAPQSSTVCAGNAPSRNVSACSAQSNVSAHNAQSNVCAPNAQSGSVCAHNGDCSQPASQRQQRHCRSSSRTSEDSVWGATSRNDVFALSPRTSLRTMAQADSYQRPSVLSVSSTPRNLDRFDTSLFDVSTDSVTSCTRHDIGASVYCQVCERCVCDVCGDAEHVTTHETNSLEAAALQANTKLSVNLEKLTSSQVKVLTSLEQQRQRLKHLEQVFHRKTEEVDMQCDALLAEVEHKRSLFLADLEQEERMRRSEIDDVIEIFEKILGVSQKLEQYTKDVLDKDTASVLQVTPALNEQLLGSILDCEACQGQPDDLHPDVLQGKVVDLRKEQALLRHVHYLSPPATPSIDVGRCARSETTVALFLLPPSPDSELIDNVLLRYYSQDQKALGTEETLTFQYHASDHLPQEVYGQQNPAQSGSPVTQVVLLEQLLCGTPYLFCASAVNRAGYSPSSPVVHCVTLTPIHSVVPVPVILEALCHTYTTSVQIYTPSPHDVAPEQSISHFLLYRPRDGKWLWRCQPMGSRVEQRVSGLEPQVQYEFVVMATNTRGECQISDKVVLEMDGSS